MKIIFFDGECILCQGFVRFLWKYDQHKTLYYAPLQGETAQKYLPGDLTKNLNTVVFYDGTLTYQKSDAILQIFSLLPTSFRLLAFLLKLFPKSIRNFFYDLIAKNRHKLFGRDKECLFILAEDQKYFLK